MNRIGNENCLVLAEIAQAHDGSLGTAHAYIDAAASAGVDAVKFQTHIASAESTPDEPWRVKFSRQDATRYDYWKRMEFTEEQWCGLEDHCRERGVTFLSTPFSLEAVDLLERIGVQMWKVGSGDVNNIPMIERMAETGKPVILSSGMSSWAELDAAVETVRKFDAEVAVMQCTTAYPTPPEKVGLNVIEQLRKRYSCRVGLSDHSGTIYTGLAAATLGIDLLEVHITFSRKTFGPDVTSSVTIEELAQLVEGVRFIEKVMKNPVDKESMATDLIKIKSTFSKSVVATREISAGTRLKLDDVTTKKPGTGIPAARLKEVIGRTVQRPLRCDEIIREEDLA